MANIVQRTEVVGVVYAVLSSDLSTKLGQFTAETRLRSRKAMEDGAKQAMPELSKEDLKKVKIVEESDLTETRYMTHETWMANSSTTKPE